VAAPITVPPHPRPHPHTCSTVFIKGLKASVDDERALRGRWAAGAPALALPPVLPPLFLEVSQVTT